MGAAIRDRDWSNSPLGSIAAWPVSLCSALGLMLNSPESMYLLWGPELTFFFNDAYRPILGPRLADALGRPIADVWPDAWDQVRPLAEQALAGESVRFEDLPVAMARYGEPEETWWSFCYSPVFDDGGVVAGVFCITNETTDRVRSTALLRASEARYRSLFNSLDTGFCVIEVLFDGAGTAIDYRFIEVNPGFERQTGMKDATGRRMREFVPDHEEQWFSMYGRVALTGEPARFEIPALALEARWFDGYAYRVDDPSERHVAILFNDVTDRRAVETARRENEEQLRLAILAADLGTWSLDLSTGTYARSERHDRMFGHSQTQPTWDIDIAERHVIEEDRPAFREAFAQAQVTGKMSVEVRVQGADGLVRWIAPMGQTYHDDEGRPVRMAGVVADTTDRKNVEAALREGEQQLRAINADLERQVIERSLERGLTWQVSPDLLSVIDLSTATFDRVNPAWTATLGWSSADIEGSPFSDFVHQDDREASGKAFAEVRQGNPVLRFENRYCHKDGSFRTLSWVAVPQDGKLFSRSRDVTVEKERAAALLLNENIVQSGHAPICAFDAEYRVTAFNKAQSDAFFRAFGQRLRIGDCLPDLVGPDQAPLIRRFMARALKGEAFQIVEEFGSHSLIKHPWEITYAPLRNGAGEVYGAFHHAVDISGRLRAQAELAHAQEALRQSQKMEAVGQLTGGVAHDFNNLLTVIKSSTDLLKRPDLAEARRERYVGAISDTVDRAAKLTGQLLAFARRQALKPEVFDVGRSVLTIGEMVKTLTGSRIAIVLRMPDEPCFVSADPSQFDTAVVNIAVNARDAMDEEGRLIISVASATEIPALRGQDVVEGDFVAVSMEDTGAGVPADRLERIFEPFYTTKGVGKGTGLGLSQVFGFAKQSGGEIAVESVVGQGTTFTLYLPRVASEASRTVPGETEALVDGRGTCVLVVEDNSEVGTFTTQTLAEMGYVTVWATNADEALAALREDADRFDVVFSDVVMPGMNGIDLAQEIQRLHRDLPIVLTSGYSHVLAQNGTFGFDLLNKPYSIEDLSRVLRKATKRQRRKRIIAQPASRP